MDTSEKVIVFDSFENLKNAIISDKNSRDMLAQRYAIRFIMLNNFSEFQALAKFMADTHIDSLDLENLIEPGENDTWITKDTLKNAIKSCTESVFVTPFSEVVRFYTDEDFRGFFNEIMLLEDVKHPGKRIYIPLIGLQNRFTDFLNHFARIQESGPIWRYDAEPQPVEVFFTKYKNFVLPNADEQCYLCSLREWLKFWKVQAPQKKIVCTSRPISAKHPYSRPDNVFNFHKIANAYDFMTQFLDLSFPFDYTIEEDKYWEELLSKIDKENPASFSFESFVRSFFNKVTLSASEIIYEWADKGRSAFDRWLLKKYVLFTGFATKYPYITLCVDSTTSLQDEYQLMSLVASRILYDSTIGSNDSNAEERRNIISANKHLFNNSLSEEDKNWLLTRTKEIYNSTGNLDVILEMCTSSFEFEKILLIGCYVQNPNNTKLLSAIKQFYPEFAAYLVSNKPSDFKMDNQWCIDYIKAYKEAKLKDEYTNEIKEFIKTKNENSTAFYSWYYSFSNSHAKLAEIKNNSVIKPDMVFWIDGLSAEFLSYILWLIEKENSDIKVVYSAITSSYLPSSTYHNRFEGADVKKYGALDALGHDSSGYKYINTLSEELNVVKEIIQEIISTCRKGKHTAAIVSDHGLSCLSRKAPSKKYSGKFEHEGRYIKASEDALNDTDYIVYKNEEEDQNYKVALTHSSLSKAPTHQVHGGCTPEEVLVPFIILSNKMSHTNYQINVSTEDIMLSDPTVRITVIPEPQNVELTCEGKTYNMSRVGTSWEAKLENISEGKHIIDVKPEGSESKEYKINIIGVSGSSDIDSLFDM